MVSVLQEMSDASTRYFLSSNNCTRKNCVLGSGLKASKSKLIKTKVVFNPEPRTQFFLVQLLDAIKHLVDAYDISPNTETM